MVIIDTSSLIEFVQGEERHISPKDFDNLLDIREGIINTIESLVIYEKNYIDGPSIDRNIPKFELLKYLSTFFTKIPLSEEEEKSIYISTKPMIDKIINNPNFSLKFNDYNQSWMKNEMGLHYGFPSAQFFDIEFLLPSHLKKLALKLKDTFKLNQTYSEAACISIIRAFYYMSLQRKYSCNLVLHPMKGSFQSQNSNQYSLNIIDLFEDTVRKEFYNRKNKWLSKASIDLKIPMISSYVLKKSNNWKEVIDNTIELRDSKEARYFRQGMNELIQTIRENDNFSLDKILSNLEKAQKKWSQNLGESLSPKRKISFSIPIVNIGTEFEIQDIDFTKSTDEKILLFIHEVLKKS